MEIIKATYYKKSSKVYKKKFFVIYNSRKYLRVEKHDFMKPVTFEWFKDDMVLYHRRVRVGKTTEYMKEYYKEEYTKVEKNIKQLNELFDVEYKKYKFEIRYKKLNRVLQ